MVPVSPLLKKVCAEVSKRVTPGRDERRHILELAQDLKRKVMEAADEEGMKARVRVEGSVAKDTWLSGEPDIDIFMCVLRSVPREEFERACLRIAKSATKGFRQVERFAEHPYLEAIVDDTIVNIVPCYRVERGHWISATDRTPFHTDYIKPLLDDRIRREIRLLKRFMKGIEAYGAEIKIGGFSGYLCELLVLNYGSFIDVLRAFAEWTGRVIIDYEGFYKGKLEELRRIFEEPLVTVDPVDKGRNVAGAVREERLSEFVVAAREFLKEPTLKFFYPPRTVAFSQKEFINALENRGSTIIFVKIGNINAVPDVLWGQLYKSQRSLHRMLQRHDFHIIQDSVWTDEENLNIFIFEIEKSTLPQMKRHLGPPISKKRECEQFLQRHLGSPRTVSGPRVEEGRWVVEIKRRHRDVVNLLTEKLEDDGRRVGIANLVSQAISEGFEILVNEENLQLYSANPEFARFLTEYLKGKPRWLQ